MKDRVTLSLGTVAAADGRFYEDLLRPPLSGSIWTYPGDDDPNQKGIYETCRRLEEVGLLESKALEGSPGVTVFFAKENARP